MGFHNSPDEPTEELVGGVNASLGLSRHVVVLDDEGEETAPGEERKATDA